MKRILLYVALLLAVTGCRKPDVPPHTLLVPDYLCTQTPTGENRTNTRMAYCGKACMQPEQYKQYSVDVSCKYTEWRNE